MTASFADSAIYSAVQQYQLLTCCISQRVVHGGLNVCSKEATWGIAWLGHWVKLTKHLNCLAL